MAFITHSLPTECLTIKLDLAHFHSQYGVQFPMFFNLYEKPARAKQHIHPMFRLERHFNEILARAKHRQKERHVLAQELSYLRATAEKEGKYMMHGQALTPRLGTLVARSVDCIAQGEALEKSQHDLLQKYHA